MEKLSVDVIKEEVQLLDPDLEVNEFGFQVAVVLISAALVTGPNTESLVAFTGYPAHLVAEISDRMHKAELWRNGTVESDHWFDGAKWTLSRLRKKSLWQNVRKINRAQLAQDTRSAAGDDFVSPGMSSISSRTAFFRSL
jgi:hypothetical protein